MKKIIIFYPHIGEYGGIERNIIALITESRNRGQEALLLCFYDNINLSDYAGFEIDTERLQDHWNPFVKSWRLRKWLQRNVDIVKGNPFIFGGKAGFYCGLGFLKNYALHYTDPPSLVSKSQQQKVFLQNVRAKISSSIMHLGVKRAQKCITMTKWNALELEKIYNRSFEVIYQGGVPASEGFEVDQKCTNVKLTLFSICRLSTSKNLDWIIKSVKELIQTNVYNSSFKEIEVIIAGKGPDLDRLVNLIKDYDLENIVSFPGFLDEQELEFHYHKADLFLVPGRQGYGLPVLEALYRGLPVVMNVESRISEILHYNSWVCISENSSASFSKTLENHIVNLRLNYPPTALLKDLPTESKWATNIGLLCGWWDK